MMEREAGSREVSRDDEAARRWMVTFNLGGVRWLPRLLIR